MTTTTTRLVHTAGLIGCLSLSPAILATDDACTGANPCRYALSSEYDGVAQDPWRDFHDDLGARFETQETVVDKQTSSSESTSNEVVVNASRQGRASSDPGSRGLFLFWLLQKGNPRGQQ